MSAQLASLKNKVSGTRLSHRLSLKPSGACANILTYAVFTIFPVVMFSVIMVLKLRGNYVQQVEHLEQSLDKVGLQANSCLADLENRTERIVVLEKYQQKCRDMLGRAGMTLASLNKAFRMQWHRSDSAMEEMNQTRHQFDDFEVNIHDRENFTQSLLGENAYLKHQLEELGRRLDNVTNTKDHLEGQLGKVKTDLDSLKLNTTRMEGEKEGLEKVLTAKSPKKGGGAKKDSKKKKDEKSDEDGEEEDNANNNSSASGNSDNNKSSENENKSDGDGGEGGGGGGGGSDVEEKPKEKKGAKKGDDDGGEVKDKEDIEKIVKEHIDKLGLANNTAAEGAKQPAAGAAAPAAAAPAVPAMHVLPVPVPVNLNGIGAQAQAAQPPPQVQAAPVQPKAQTEQPQPKAKEEPVQEGTASNATTETLSAKAR